MAVEEARTEVRNYRPAAAHKLSDGLGLGRADGLGLGQDQDFEPLGLKLALAQHPIGHIAELQAQPAQGRMPGGVVLSVTAVGGPALDPAGVGRGQGVEQGNAIILHPRMAQERTQPVAHHRGFVDQLVDRRKQPEMGGQ